ncbi:MAG: hypothetical protein P1V97_13075 [Planctomycetota bacterium]|nr:hypothetical protein [Planctomycetota bacterium]
MMDKEPAISDSQQGKPWRRLCLIPMILIIWVNAWAQLSFQAVIEVGEGYGWDGVLYGELAENFPDRFEELLATQAGERRQRVLPSLIVSVAIAPIVENRHEAVIVAFQILNTLCLTLGVLVWLGIAKEKALSIGGAWLGFIALFLNYQNMKFAYYDPVLTDSMTLLFALLVYWSWLRESHVGLIFSLFCGSFVSSSILLLSIPLLVFRKGALDTANKKWVYAVALTVSAGLFAVLIHEAYWTDYQVPEGWRPPMKELYPLSIMISVAYVFLGARYLLQGGLTPSWAELKTRFHWRMALTIGTIQGLVLLIIHQWAYDIDGPSFLDVIAVGPNSIPFRSLNLPFVFGLAHLFYWGPVYALVLCYWRSMCRVCHHEGVGPTVYLFAFVFLSLSYETRHLIAFLPILVSVLAKSLEEKALSWPFYLGFLVSSVAMSRCWLSIDSPNILPQLSSLWPG